MRQLRPHVSLHEILCHSRSSGAGNAQQELGERITFRFNGENVTQVVFRSTQNSFELDRIAVVPEPATWARMLMGFGGLGAMIRRRRSLAAFA